MMQASMISWLLRSLQKPGDRRAFGRDECPGIVRLIQNSNRMQFDHNRSGLTVDAATMSRLM